MSTPNIKEVVREKYGQVARSVTSGAGNSCCGEASALQASCDPITSNLYDTAQEGEVPTRRSRPLLVAATPRPLPD